jgi:hypothetical protein
MTHHYGISKRTERQEMNPTIDLYWLKFSAPKLSENIQSCNGPQRHRVTAPKTMIVSRKGKK